jgi:hypothetical protein
VCVRARVCVCVCVCVSRSPGRVPVEGAEGGDANCRVEDEESK